MARAATVVSGELVSLVAQPGAVPYGRYKNLQVETRAKEHFPTGELNTKKNAGFSGGIMFCDRDLVRERDLGHAEGF